MKEGIKQVAFMGGKKVGYECLNFLLKSEKQLGIEVCCVFENQSKLSSKENSVGGLAKQHKRSLYNNQDNLLDISDLDFIISVQYNEILKQKHIDQAKTLAINLHMAPLPEYRGCNQFSFAIIDECPEFGTSLHRLETSVDGGDLIAERRFQIPEECFVQDLYEKTVKESVELFETEIGRILNEDFELFDQTELGKTRKSGFHFRKEVNDIKNIDETWSIDKQKRYFRATWFPPFSPPKSLQTGKEFDMNWYNSMA